MLTTFDITGMDCANCAKSIETGVAKLDGVTTCTLTYHNAKLKVGGEVEPEIIAARIKQLGYTAILEDDVAGQKPAMTNDSGIRGFVGFLLARRETALALLGLLLVLPGLVLDEILPISGLRFESPIFAVTSLAALGVAGLPIARSAWRQLTINHEISINLLMTIAAVGAVVIGAYTEAGLVMVLFAIGEALEGYTAVRARSAIQSLMAVAPNEATVLRPCMDCREHLGQGGYVGGACPFCGIEEQRVAVGQIVIGDVVLVRPGEKVAMDGQVRKGTSQLNQAPITGESMPVEKQMGDSVFAGSINGEGVLEVVVTRLAKDNTLARIIKMVEEAQEKRAPAQKFVDRFAKYYTPVVVLVAMLVAALPPLILGASFWGEQGWLYRALELLVVACPCALVVSTPVAFISAISNAAKHGVLVKGGAVLEALNKTKAIAFDKTGTLTMGKPQVVRVQSVACLSAAQPCEWCDDLLALATSVERRSQHPLAHAVVKQAEVRQVFNRYAAADNVSAITGNGVLGEVAGHSVIIGSHAYFDRLVPHDRVICDEVEAASKLGQTPLMMGVDGLFAGYITVADTVRQSSRDALAQLKKAGKYLVMLTGDNAGTARHIAQQVGVTDIRAQLLPEDKVEAIKALLGQHGNVAMVGDGVNDAPALATATVGIAMGAGGTAQAMETADVVLMQDDLRALPFVFRLSQATMRTIRVNVVFAIGIKLAFFMLVLMGLGTMWLAVLADVGASLLVTLNGMRLLGTRGVVSN